MTAMKLQKLVYYSQAWHLVWDERPLFDEPVQAWANGPVVPDLTPAAPGWCTRPPPAGRRRRGPRWGPPAESRSRVPRSG
ncbi:MULTISPECIES: type II toxin-antitoxin system antitoxin SocA domain-containing protein [unclassified Saccharopolyspora]|uniref:Panacea domain-containing protein n=1 Tax=Saccharopolyspora TaxID=1835 RepID=UPI0027DD3632|nr:type II toxin-antitoxin system antitoxin SocA domain-containing protein [Saccharopolyspora sp. HNM0986]